MKNIKSVIYTTVILFLILSFTKKAEAQEVIKINAPMTPPEWALLERQVLQTSSSAIEEFCSHFCDENGTYLHKARWGALDGADDVIEFSKLWTILYSLGASDKVMELYHKTLEACLRQYAAITTTSTDVAKYGSYYKEFLPQSDWKHQGEGIQGLMFQALCEPDNLLMQQRYRRFAGFYMNEDPDAMNYDPQQKIIRSFWNGSKGPMLREGTTYDWGGDFTEGKYNLIHHVGALTTMKDYAQEYQGIVDHFYFFPQSTAGDHSLNLAATQLALDAYMIDHETKYSDWLLEYASAWRDRAAANNGNFPTNIGLDGKVGTGVADKWYFDKKGPKNKWYMGTYGWNFSFYHWRETVYHENVCFLGIWPGMSNAFLLTGDPSYIDALRKQIDNLYDQKKVIDGVEMIPRNYGIHIDRDQPRKVEVFDVRNEKLFVPDGKGVEGWYNWTPNMRIPQLIDIYLMSMDRKDVERISKDSWISFLEGNNQGYPEESLRRQIEYIRSRMEGMRKEISTPDTRLADWALEFNPANNTNELVQLMTGGNLQDHVWSLHARVRYFDPENNRAGIPEDVAALVTKMEGGKTWITLVNTNQVKSKKVIVQTGAFGEHQCQSVTVGDKTYPVNRRYFEVKLEPGSGSELVITADRYANQPTWEFPW